MTSQRLVMYSCVGCSCVVQFLKEEQLHKLCEVGVHAGEVGVRADVVRLLGLAARLALRDVPTSTPLLNVRVLYSTCIMSRIASGNWRELTVFVDCYMHVYSQKFH